LPFNINSVKPDEKSSFFIMHKQNQNNVQFILLYFDNENHICRSDGRKGGQIMTVIVEKNSGLDKIASTMVRRNYALVAKTVKKLKKP
jgi:hypothetical protein